MNRKALATVAAFLGMVAAIGYLFFGDTWIRQMRHLKMAEQHLPTIRKVLKSHSEFLNVDAGVNTGGGGIILVVGHLRTQGDLDSLKKEVANTLPPVEVIYVVKTENGDSVSSHSYLPSQAYEPTEPNVTLLRIEEEGRLQPKETKT